MKKFKAIGGVVLILVLGIVIGALITYSIGMNRLNSALKSPEDFTLFLAQRISDQIELDPSQEEQLVAVLTETQPKIRKIREEATPRLRRVLEEAEREIMSFLRPGQKEQFRKLIIRKNQFLQWPTPVPEPAEPV